MPARALLLAAVVTAVTAAGAPARGDTLDLVGPGARSVARAGATVVSTDDGAALLLNPAGLARRTSRRAQAGLTLVERWASFASDAVFANPALPAGDRAGVEALPWGAIELGLGERVTAGIAFLTPTDVAYTYAQPPADYQPSDADAHIYPHRYAGTRLRLVRHTAAAGLGVRALPWLAAGAAALASRVSLDHGRMISAEAAAAGATAGELRPAWDMPFSAEAGAWVPGTSVGLVIAPLDVPIELAASFTWTGDADLHATPELGDTRGLAGSGARNATAQIAPDAAATLALPLPSTFRAGARFLGGRWVAELQADYSRIASAPPVWTIEGVSITPDQGTARPLTTVPLGPIFQDGYALRAAVDVDLVPGAIAVTAGYAFTRRLSPRSRATPILPDAASHTVAFGLEGRVAGAQVTLGIARSERPAETIPAADSGVTAVAPFASTPIPVAGGRYDGAVTTIAFGVDIDLP